MSQEWTREGRAGTTWIAMGGAELTLLLLFKDFLLQVSVCVPDSEAKVVMTYNLLY